MRKKTVLIITILSIILILLTGCEFNFKQNSTKEDEETKVEKNQNDEYTAEQLEKMALDYYEAKTGYRPSYVSSQENEDGTISIQLYDNLDGHNSTSDWYTVDKKTAVGKDILENKIDLKNVPEKSENEYNNTLKESFKVTYETVGVRNITVKGASFVCNQNEPHITGINSSAGKKIEDYIKNWYKTVWKDIADQTDDEYITDILEQIDKNNKDYPESQSGEIGFKQSVEVIFLNNDIVTFQYVFDGGLGGSSWKKTSGASFDLKTGEKINIKDIVISKDNYISECKKYVFEQLKNDSRYSEVIEMHKNDYEEIINKNIEQLDGYLVKDGIVCVQIPKYEIASGASGEFKYTIPYSKLKNLIDSKYIF